MALGAPVAMQNMVISLGGMIVQRVVNSFDVVFVAGYTATNKLYGVLEIAATSFGYAMTVYVGQNLGVAAYGRIRRGVRAGAAAGVLTSAVICAGDAALRPATALRLYHLAGPAGGGAGA